MNTFLYKLEDLNENLLLDKITFEDALAAVRIEIKKLQPRLVLPPIYAITQVELDVDNPIMDVLLSISIALPSNRKINLQEIIKAAEEYFHNRQGFYANERLQRGMDKTYKAISKKYLNEAGLIDNIDSFADYKQCDITFLYIHDFFMYVREHGTVEGINVQFRENDMMHIHIYNDETNREFTLTRDQYIEISKYYGDLLRGHILQVSGDCENLGLFFHHPGNSLLIESIYTIENNMQFITPFMHYIFWTIVDAFYVETIKIIRGRIVFIILINERQQTMFFHIPLSVRDTISCLSQVWTRQFDMNIYIEGVFDATIELPFTGIEIDPLPMRELYETTLKVPRETIEVNVERLDEFTAYAEHYMEMSIEQLNELRTNLYDDL